MSDLHDCEGGVGEVRWIMVGNALDSDCIPCPGCTSVDRFGPEHGVREAARPWPWRWPQIMPLGDSDDCAPGLETPGDPRFPQLLALAKIQAGPNAMLVRWATMDLRAGFERDHDRPSPGDDITRPAFDALDRE